MLIIPEWVHRLWRTLRLRRSDRDLEEELRLHVEFAIEDAGRQGRPLDAERAARLRVGGVAHAMDVLRDQRGLPTVGGIVQDLRHASRSLRRAPGFATLAVVTLGFGLGATATVFSAVDALLVRPLAVEAPYELFVVRRAGERASDAVPPSVSPVTERIADGFADSLASFTFPVTLIASGTGTRARAAFVTLNYFEVLGVRAALGELFHTHEDRDVVVVSHQFWRERLGGRSSAVGEPVRIGDATFMVGGVTPPGFGGLQLDIALDVWIPSRRDQP